MFVFRFEDPALADAVLTGPPPAGVPSGGALRPIVYRLDMTEPESLFVARAFQMRDGDAIFATNAPFSELRKVVTLFSQVLVPVQGASTIGAN